MTNRLAARNLDAWLDLIEENRLVFATTLAGGPLGDRERDAIMDEAHEQLVDRMLENHTGTSDHPPRVRLAVHGYLGFLEQVVKDWLTHQRVGREEVREVLLEALFAVMGTVVPRVASGATARANQSGDGPAETLAVRR